MTQLIRRWPPSVILKRLWQICLLLNSKKTTYEKTKKAIFSKWRGLSAKWLFILSTVLGIIAGTCFWIFISRCGNEECFLKL